MLIKTETFKILKNFFDNADDATRAKLTIVVFLRQVCSKQNKEKVVIYIGLVRLSPTQWLIIGRGQPYSR